MEPKGRKCRLHEALKQRPLVLFPTLPLLLYPYFSSLCLLFFLLCTCLLRLAGLGGGVVVCFSCLISLSCLSAKWSPTITSKSQFQILKESDWPCIVCLSIIQSTMASKRHGLGIQAAEATTSQRILSQIRGWSS